MLRRIVEFLLRFRAFHAEAVRQLACEIRQKREAERREMQAARMKRKRERRQKQYCFGCEMFRTALCNSQNPRGWCRSFRER